MTTPRSPLVSCSVALTLALAPATPLHAAPAEPPPLAVPEPAAPEPAEPEPEPEPAPEPPTPVVTPAPASTSSAATTRLVLLPIVVEGSDNPTLAPRVRGHLEQGLSRGAFSIVDAATVERLAPGGCETPACLSALHDGTGASYALRTRVTVNDRDYQLQLELLRTRDAFAVASRDERCDLCGREEIGKLVETQAALLRKDLEDLVQGPPRLTITSQPSGAFVFIDGQIVGQTPLERTLVEGKHVVRVTYDGYVAEERPLELSRGLRKSLDIQLVREPRAARQRAVGWAGVGVGIPALVAGTALLALNDRPIRSDCDAADRNQDLDGDCRFLHDTAWAGGATLAAGAALIGIGITLLLVHRGGPARTRNRASIRPAGLGIAGRF